MLIGGDRMRILCIHKWKYGQIENSNAKVCIECGKVVEGWAEKAIKKANKIPQEESLRRLQKVTVGYMEKRLFKAGINGILIGIVLGIVIDFGWRCI